jgi:heme exporter protein C
VICCSIGLTTGPLWAKPVWGVWWTWDARLTSTFVMWMLYVSYLILRGLIEDPEKKATLSAVFGIFASLDLPLVYVSNRLWRTTHPQPVILGGDNSGLQATMAWTLVFCMIAVCCVMVLVLLDRYKLELMRNEVAELQFRANQRVTPAKQA